MRAEAKQGTIGTMSTGRNTIATDLKVLKCPGEGGTGLDLEQWTETLERHVATWPVGDVAAKMISSKARVKLEEPEADDDEDKVSWKEMIVYREQMKKFLVNKDNLEQNERVACTMVQKYVSDMTESKLKCIPGYTTAKDGFDLIWMLNKIDDIMANFNCHDDPIMANIFQALKVFTIKQGAQEENEDFVKRVRRTVKVYEDRGGDLLWSFGILELIEKVEDRFGLLAKVKSDKSIEVIIPSSRTTTPTAQHIKDFKDSIDATRTSIKEKILARIATYGADETRFSSLKKGLENDYLKGTNSYSDDLTDLLLVLNNYKPEYDLPSSGTPGTNGTSFLQSNEQDNEQDNETRARGRANTARARDRFMKGIEGRFRPDIKCRLCGFRGHFKNSCPLASMFCDEQGDALRAQDSTSRETRSRE